MRVVKRIVISGGVTSLIWSVLYGLGRTWGSTREERRRHLPGDELVEHPQFSSDHATSIAGTPEEIWPWLVQMGWHRGGFYTYRWVDRLLFPANAPSADRILPEYQHLKVGDHIPDGSPEAECFFQVEILEPNKMLTLRSWTHLPPKLRDKPRARLEWTWAFHLEPINKEKTRLLFRVRGTLKPWWLLAMYRLFIMPADFVMGRSLCSGLKERVEKAR
jgi:hypothetical protein